MKPKEIIKNAIDTYGVEAQVDMAIEEMSELIKALVKYKRAQKEPSKWDYKAIVRANVVEEIADVDIMIEQLKMIFDCHNLVERQKTNKLNRLKNRLGEQE